MRAELAENEVFPTHSPLTVELWDRLLAYGAALGVAGGASGPLPMGTESDTDAWSAYGGRWRPVRVVYPRLWPPGWGLDPFVAHGRGHRPAALAGALVLYWLGPVLFDAGIFGALLIVPCAAVLLGIALSVMGYADLRSTVEVTGPILRLRVFGDEKRARYYLAVDDGESPHRPRVACESAPLPERRRRVETVTVRVTRISAACAGSCASKTRSDVRLDSARDDAAQALSRPGRDRGSSCGGEQSRAGHGDRPRNAVSPGASWLGGGMGSSASSISSIARDASSFCATRVAPGTSTSTSGTSWASSARRRTRSRGEPSLAVDELTMLSKNRSPLPDTFHGVTDQETRYRKRYLDLLMNDETRELFLLRVRGSSRLSAPPSTRMASSRSRLRSCSRATAGPSPIRS